MLALTRLPGSAMLRGLVKRKGGPIGCALSERAVQLVQLQRGQPGGAVLGQANVSDSAHERGRFRQLATEALHEALNDGAFVGRDAVSCLPAGQVSYRHVRLPRMPDDEFTEAVHWLLAKELSWNVKQFRSSFFFVRDLCDNGKHLREVAAFGASLADLDEHATMLSEAGLAPTAIDVRPGAIARCLALHPNGSGSQIVVDLGDAEMRLIAVSDGLPRLIRSIGMGMRDLIDATTQAPLASLARHSVPTTSADNAKHLLCDRAAIGVDPVKDLDPSAKFFQGLSREVSLFVQYLNDVDPSCLHHLTGYVIGAGRYECGFVNALSGLPGVDFHSMSPTLAQLASCQSSPNEDDSSDSWMVAFGLALYGQENAFHGDVI